MPHRTRVFHLIKSLGRGGAETLLPETLRYADRERFTYGYGYFLPWKDHLVVELEAQDVPVTCFEARSNLQVLLAARQVKAHLEGWSADVLHAHLPLAGIVARIAGRWAGVPVVYTEHNVQERYHPITRWLNRATWGGQQAVVAVSEGVARSARTHNGTEVFIRTVPNGIDHEQYRVENTAAGPVRSSFGIPQEAPVVGTVAVFRTQKRLDHWLRVAQAVRTAIPGAHFVLVGDGPLRVDLEAQARTLALQDCVHFAGLQEDVRPYLAAMDVYLMTSAFEGLPLALLEAMAMQRPVVTTAVGGIPEVIMDGTEGFLLEEDDRKGLTTATHRLLTDGSLRTRLGTAARRTVVERFSVERMTAELEELYEEVAARRDVEDVLRGEGS